VLPVSSHCVLIGSYDVPNVLPTSSHCVLIGSYDVPNVFFKLYPMVSHFCLLSFAQSRGAL
jgi:hypothetical protein